MGYSNDPDPRRGPRRYGPSSGRPVGQSSPGGPGGPGGRGSDNPPYSPPPAQPHPGPAVPGPAYPGPPYQSQPYGGPAGPSLRVRRPGPAQPGQRAWSQTTPPTRQFPAQPGRRRHGRPPVRPPAAMGTTTPRPPRGPRRPPPDDPGQPRARRTPGGVLAARIVALVAAVAVLLGVGVAYVFTDVLQANSGTSDAAANAGSGGVMFDGGMTILLVGSDARTDADGNPLSAEELAQVGTEDDGGGINTDTMMLVHIPRAGARRPLSRMPRDTWITQKVVDQVVGPYARRHRGHLQGQQDQLLLLDREGLHRGTPGQPGCDGRGAAIERESNEAGRTMLIRVVQAFTGMKVDHYAEVNLLGFYLLSNAIGGVPVCLNAPSTTRGRAPNFAAGPQDVQGTAALAFVRQRHGLPAGDLDRVQRQQAFLSGAVGQDPVRRHAGQPGEAVRSGRRGQPLGGLRQGLLGAEFRRADGQPVVRQHQLRDAAHHRSGDVDQQRRAGDQPRGDQGVLRRDRQRRRRADQRAGHRRRRRRSGIGDGRRAGRHRRRRGHGYAADIITRRGSPSAGWAWCRHQVGERAADHRGALRRRRRAAAQQVLDAFGVGELVPDDAVKSGHVLVVVGTDLKVPGSGLRSPGASFQLPAPPSPAPPRPPASLPPPNRLPPRSRSPPSRCHASTEPGRPVAGGRGTGIR